MDIVYKHKIPVQLRFNDADALGHINNTVYFSFYDLGKTSYFNEVRGEILDVKKIDIVVVHAEVDFLSPVLLTDNIEVHTRVSTIGNKSLTLMQQIVDVKSDVVKCVCKTIMVGFDQVTSTSQKISKEWRDAISKYEGRKFYEH